MLTSSEATKSAKLIRFQNEQNDIEVGPYQRFLKRKKYLKLSNLTVSNEDMNVDKSKNFKIS